jgi:uncharacterized membrane protein YsdA (DUF1294 family)
MECSKCGGKVDRITENNYFCRKCGARQEKSQLQPSSGLLNLVVALNYVTMVLLGLFGLFLFFLFSFYMAFYVITPLVAAVILFWVNGELKKLEASKRKYSIIANVLITIAFIFGGIGISISVAVYPLAMGVLQYYVLYMHKPTVELFRQNR